jgi:dTDP-4-dehydrorhamnose 3,5-epimerase
MLRTMRIDPIPLTGAFVVTLEPAEDERGFFARAFDADAFAALGLASRFAQCSLSFNRRKGTLRGLHYQAPPNMEAKLVRCVRGAVFDVIVDLRAVSPTFGQWWGTEISADNRLAVYVPEGFAHGFQTLADASELYYQISVPYVPEGSRGLAWDDPALDIAWPDIAGAITSDRDRAHPLLADVKPLK